MPRQPYVPTPFPNKVMSMLGLQSWAAAELAKIADSMPRPAAREIREFGIVGDGRAADAGPAVKMFDTIDNNTTVELPVGAKIPAETTLSLRDRQNVHFTHPGTALGSVPNDSVPCVVYRGPTGGDVIDMDESRLCSVRGFRIEYSAIDDFSPNPPVALRGVVLDGYDPHLGSSCRVEDMQLSTPRFIPGLMIGVDVSPTAKENQEFHAVRRCGFALGGGYTRAFASVNKDSDLLTATDAAGNPAAIFPVPLLVGRRVRCAVVGRDGALYTLDTTIKALVGKLPTATIQLAAPASFSGVCHCVVGEATGVAVRISSANAKGIAVDENVVQGMAALLWQVNGSSRCIGNHTTTNECDFIIDGAADNCQILGTVCDGALQHLRWRANQPLELVTKADYGQTMPGTAFIDIGGPANAVEVHASSCGSSLEEKIALGATLYRLASTAQLDSHANTYGGLTLDQLGWTDRQTLASIRSFDYDIPGYQKRELLLRTGVVSTVRPRVPGDPVDAFTGDVGTKGDVGMASAFRAKASALEGTGANAKLAALSTAFGTDPAAITPAGLTTTVLNEE